MFLYEIYILNDIFVKKQIMLFYIIATAAFCALQFLFYGVGFMISRFVKKQRYVLIPLLIFVLLSYFFVDGWHEYAMLMVFVLPTILCFWRGIDRGQFFTEPELEDYFASIGEDLGNLISGNFFSND